MDTKESYTIKTSTTKYFIYMDAIRDTGIIAISTSYTLLFVDLVKGEEIYKITRYKELIGGNEGLKTKIYGLRISGEGIEGYR